VAPLHGLSIAGAAVSTTNTVSQAVKYPRRASGLRCPAACGFSLSKGVLIRSPNSVRFVSSGFQCHESEGFGCAFLMRVLGILGSPSAVSRSGSLLQLAQSRLQVIATRQHTVSVRELPAEALLNAQFDHPLIRQALEEVQQAQVVLVATPIYKAAYSGLLKAFLDLLPQDALRDKCVLPLATGGSIAHLLALDYALKPVLSVLGARDILDPVFATDQQIPWHETLGHVPSADVQERVDRTLRMLKDRADDVQRRQDAALEREALLARLQQRAVAGDGS